MPEIPVEDDPRVQQRFEFYTENPVGRETFQQMLFRCGAYKDMIQSALVRHGLPADLIAVVFTESGCAPLARSPAGAEGLWQFIPEAARAYHLRIIPDQVDERHSPQKSTEAAIAFLSDMYAKLKSWDLVFAGYSCGPWGIMARLERVEGENVGFWELVDAGMLPDETANYAPTIQAIALILNNLQRLKFGAIQMRAPQLTMDLVVPPNTRLSLIARASALSVDELRRLNLDIKGFTTPNIQNFAVQVPKDSVRQARDTLTELLKSGDASDQCAPPNFDWGRQRFTNEMAAACAKTLAAQPTPAPKQ
jgi:membrane-bound lytic murein transglycosylase D